MLWHHVALHHRYVNDDSSLTSDSAEMLIPINICERHNIPTTLIPHPQLPTASLLYGAGVEGSSAGGGKWLPISPRCLH